MDAPEGEKVIQLVGFLGGESKTQSMGATATTIPFSTTHLQATADKEPSKQEETCPTEQHKDNSNTIEAQAIAVAVVPSKKTIQVFKTGASEADKQMIPTRES